MTFGGLGHSRNSLMFVVVSMRVGIFVALRHWLPKKFNVVGECNACSRPFVIGVGATSKLVNGLVFDDRVVGSLASDRKGR